ncbi:hypothetical protein JCM10212_006153 [Sporobolomyces blumeae]
MSTAPVKSKVPKASLDKTYGPGPNPQALYKSAATFIKYWTAFQWTHGYDLRVSFDKPTVKTTLVCATHPLCPFTATAVYHFFQDGPVQGQHGYRISHVPGVDPDKYHAEHDHLAPYVAVDLDVENRRRASLGPGHPSLEKPPFVPASTTSASTSLGASPRVTMATTGQGGSGSPAPSQATTNGRRQGAARGPGSNSSSRRSSSVSASETTTTMTHAFGPIVPLAPFVPPGGGGGAMANVSSTPASSTRDSPARHSPAPPLPLSTAPVARAPSRSAPPPPLLPSTSTSSSSTVRRPTEPLSRLLLDISPSFLPYLALFPKNGIPLDTSPQDLVDLDSGEPACREVWNLFSEVRGLPGHCVAAGTAGIKKAKKRQLESGFDREGGYVGSDEVDARIVTGMEKRNLDKWVRRKIEQGTAIVQAMDPSSLGQD